MRQEQVHVSTWLTAGACWQDVQMATEAEQRTQRHDDLKRTAAALNQVHPAPSGTEGCQDNTSPCQCTVLGAQPRACPDPADS